MKIILKEKIKNLGSIGDIVTVKDGYGRNFLIPTDKALHATPKNIELLEQHKEHLIKLSNEKLVKAEQLAKTLENKPFIFLRSASETGVLYGSVSARNVIESLNKGGIGLSFNQVEIASNQIKTLGVFPVILELHHDVQVQILVVVARNNEDAENLLKKYHAKQQEQKVATAEQAKLQNQETAEQV